MKTVQTLKGPVQIRKYPFGWAVARGPYEGVGSFTRQQDLIEAIDGADSAADRAEACRSIATRTQDPTWAEAAEHAERVAAALVSYR